MTLRTRTNIKVTEKGHWIFKGKPIENEQILNYFKMQLRRDEYGYYIDNAFGEKHEHGYLEEVEGFPVTIVSLGFDDFEGRQLLFARFDFGANAWIEPSALAYFADDALACLLNDQVPARLSAASMASMADHLSGSEESGYSLQIPGGETISVQRAEWSDWFRNQRIPDDAIIMDD